MLPPWLCKKIDQRPSVQIEDLVPRGKLSVHGSMSGSHADLEKIVDIEECVDAKLRAHGPRPVTHVHYQSFQRSSQGKGAHADLQ